ncbi:cytochrome b [Sphingomonas hengshuiensis]|nr:cytochrome b [Sphingomonas hengshuiensis]
MDRGTEAVIDSVAGIAEGDDAMHYDRVSIALHWATAALVIAQFVTAQTWGWFDRPTHRFLVITHMSLGVLLTAVIVARLVWRLLPGHRVAPLTAGWQTIAARAVHGLLYLLLAAEAVLGWIGRWSEGKPLNFFGLLLQPPFAAWSREEHHMMMERHELVGWIIVVLAFGHALAALYHHYHVRDRVLVRMAPWVKAPLAR